MISSAAPAAPAGPGGIPGILLLPALWVALVAGLSAYGIVAMWPATYASGLPAEAEYWLYSQIAVALVTTVWGFWLLGNVYRRSPGFPRAFTIWQCFRIAAICLSLGFTLVSDVFVASFSSFAFPLAETAIGVAFIFMLNRSPATATVFRDEGARPPALVYVINAVLGILLGAVAGMLAGFLVGAVLAEVYEVSCFEGGCGYFAAAIGLLGMVIGAILGLVVAVRLTGRRRRKAAT